MKKVYFAGSIRGGRADAELYGRVIRHIQREHIVLTEHIGDLSLSKLEDVENSDVAIYEQDTAWLREADLLIAECTTPSLGVGMNWLMLKAIIFRCIFSTISLVPDSPLCSPGTNTSIYTPTPAKKSSCRW